LLREPSCCAIISFERVSECSRSTQFAVGPLVSSSVSRQRVSPNRAGSLFLEAGPHREGNFDGTGDPCQSTATGHPLIKCSDGKDLGAQKRMHEEPVSFLNSVVHRCQTRARLLLHRSAGRPRTGHRSGCSQACGLFFQNPSPLSRSRAYRNSKGRDTRKSGPEKELALTFTLLAEAMEAILSRSGIRSYFGFEDRIMMNLSGHRPRRRIVAGCSVGSSGRRACRLQNRGFIDSLSISGASRLVERTGLYDSCLAGIGMRPSLDEGPFQRGGNRMISIAIGEIDDPVGLSDWLEVRGTLSSS
jgi:hypothetical protein